MKVRRLLFFALVLSLTGCGADENLHAISNAEWESVMALRGGKFTLMSNTDLATLRRDADLGKAVGRYRTERVGLRTWRLDTATGQTCLLFTTEEDWKKSQTSMEGCAD